MVYIAKIVGSKSIFYMFIYLRFAGLLPVNILCITNIITNKLPHLFVKKQTITKRLFDGWMWPIK